MNKLFILGIVVVLGFGWFFYLNQSKKATELNPPQQNQVSNNNDADEEVDFEAGFVIFTNGTFRVFTDSKYHNKSEDVFITAENPNVVSVKKSGITWGDFFETLHLEINNECLTTGTGQTFCTNSQSTLKFYKNGESADDLLGLNINDGDQILISYGSENEQEIEKQFEQITDIYQKRK